MNPYYKYLPDELLNSSDDIENFSIALEVMEDARLAAIGVMMSIEDDMFDALDTEDERIAFERYLAESEYPDYVEQLFLSEAFYALVDAWRQFNSGDYSIAPVQKRQLVFNAKTKRYMGISQNS